MKKNFLMVASLLIAAMLMVVSCSQEVAPKNDGLVEAKLNVAYSRDLSVTGDTNTSGISLTYTMSPKWSIGDASEIIYGEKTSETPFDDNGSIGYVTPGLWEVKVFAYETEKNEEDIPSTKKIFEGTANAYFSNQNKSVTVYLAPTSNQTNTLEFNITMQDLVGNLGTSGTGSYKLTYSVYGTGSSPIEEGELSKKTDVDSNNDGKKDMTRYEGTQTLSSGFYRVTVSIYSVETGKEDKLVGGITKGLLLSGEKTATISGHIEPSDYEKVTIDAFYIDVKTVVSYATVNYTAAKGNEAAKAEVEFTVSDNKTTGNKDRITPTYIWYVMQNDTNEVVSTNDNKFKVSFEAPGYKTVTCQTIYTATVGSTEYSFADTQSKQVYIDPEKFGTTDTVSAQN